MVCPGPTDTALLKSVAATSSNPEKLMEAFKNAVPMRRLGQPEDYRGSSPCLPATTPISLPDRLFPCPAA
nr:MULTISPECIES: hypothetical protein [unclassified Pseudomonas]